MRHASRVLAVAICAVLVMTVAAYAAVDEFGGASFSEPYAPYTAGPVVHRSDVEYAPYVAGPVIHASDLVPYVAGPVIHPSDLEPYAAYTVSPAIERYGNYLIR